MGQERAERWAKLRWTIWDRSLGQSSEFEIFTIPGLPKPFPDVPVRTTPDLTDSRDSLDQSLKWLDVCESSHDCLPKVPSVLPKRIIDIGSSQVRLHETTDAEVGRYACLSHCWGYTRPACRTTLATLEANKQQIPFNPLPATFQDAIDFTRRLGLRYIWIDSICIIQDSAEDWNEQCGQMADIYSNAYVTLCATSSPNDNTGCYLHTPYQLRPRKLTVQRRSDGRNYDVYVQPALRLQHIPGWHEATQSSLAQYFPLLTRAWAFQERLLSPRLIHFAAGELLWECNGLSTCHHHATKYSGSSEFMAYHSEKRMITEALASTDSTKLEEQWRRTIIFTFSGLSLTYGKDKLPALSGVAKRMLQLRPGDEYLAGLWRTTIVRDLQWYRFGHDCRRSATWRAPSWSWASVDGVVQLSNGLRHHEVRTYSTVVDASVTLSGSDPTGEISAGHLVLSGPLVTVELYEASSWRHEYERYLLKQVGGHTQLEMQAELHIDCPSDFRTGFLAVGENLACLRIGNLVYKKDFCLVLKKLLTLDDSGLPLYQRIGRIEHNAADLEKAWYPPDLEPTIVKII